MKGTLRTTFLVSLIVLATASLGTYRPVLAIELVEVK